MDYKQYKEKYSKLIELERREEMQWHEKEIRNLTGLQRQKKGRAVLNLKPKDLGKGLGDNHIVRFVKSEKLPETEISIGDLVMASIKSPLNRKNPSGTVIEKTKYSFSVAFQNKPSQALGSKNVRIDLYVNDITFQRMKEALSNIEKSQSKRKLLLGKSSITFEKESENFESEFLNNSQRKAVEESLKANDLFLIHGPPGTGKTTTLVESISKHVEKGNKVLATADSNIAVDNLVEFLAKKGKKVVRIGHPARVTLSLREHSLDILLQEKEDFKKSKEIKEEVEKLNEHQKKLPFPSGGKRRGLSDKKILEASKKGDSLRGIPSKKISKIARWIEIQGEIKELLDKSKELEKKAIKEIIENSDVVCSTNSASGGEILQEYKFDVVAIDEATQSTEPSCLIPYSLGKKLLMAGDHKQLPPTILNQEAKNSGLEKTLFERLLENYGCSIKSLLKVQYRMNEKIVKFPGDYFYNGELETPKSISCQRLEIELKDNKLKEILYPENSVVFIDTLGNSEEFSKKGSTSKLNKKESEIVKKVVNSLLDAGMKENNIGVISPYEDQVDYIDKSLKKEDIEVKTVDGFQGRQKEVIIVSFTRSNSGGNIGFLSDLRRLNVSITRAKKKLILVGDSGTLENHTTYRDLIEYIRENNGYVKF